MPAYFTPFVKILLSMTTFLFVIAPMKQCPCTRAGQHFETARDFHFFKLILRCVHKQYINYNIIYVQITLMSVQSTLFRLMLTQYYNVLNVRSSRQSEKLYSL